MSARRPLRSLSGAGAVAAIIAAGLVAPQAALAVPLLPPTASFTATPNDPAMVGQTVEFDGSGSTGDVGGSTITTYEWDLDGDHIFETNTGATPTTARSYSTPGTIEVRLIVTDSDGETDDALVTLRVNAPPVAGFIFEPATPAIGEPVTFASTSSDPDGSIPSDSHRWDFDGDGVFDEVGATVTTTFDSPGTHTVSLEVTDADGATAVATRSVVPNRPPDASFVISPEAPRAGDTVKLTSTSSDPDGPVAGQAWDIDGDGEFDDGDGTTVERTFDQAGIFELSLRVVDSAGAADVITSSVMIGPRALELMSPFPVVRLAGKLRSSGKTLIERLTVAAPDASEVTVRCRDKSCPFKQRHRTAGSSRVRFHGFGQPLNPGTKLEIFVTDPAKIGKFTSFRLRNGKAPKRKDRCLAGENLDAMRCPS